jgi:hypothetical protein
MPDIRVTLPLKVQSPNVKEHWTAPYQRNKFNHKKIKENLFLDKPKISLPCEIVLKRTGVRIMDLDNFVTACKGIKDSIASLILEKKRGVDDDNPGIRWIYEQVKGKPEFTIKISWDLPTQDVHLLI